MSRATLLYLCDMKMQECCNSSGCCQNGGDCSHTGVIKHARNKNGCMWMEKYKSDKGIMYWEVEKDEYKRI